MLWNTKVRNSHRICVTMLFLMSFKSHCNCWKNKQNQHIGKYSMLNKLQHDHCLVCNVKNSFNCNLKDFSLLDIIHRMILGKWWHLWDGQTYRYHYTGELLRTDSGSSWYYQWLINLEWHFTIFCAIKWKNRKYRYLLGLMPFMVMRS